MRSRRGCAYKYLLQRRRSCAMENVDQTTGACITVIHAISAKESVMPTNSGMELPTHKVVRLIFEYDGDTVRLDQSAERRDGRHGLRHVGSRSPRVLRRYARHLRSHAGARGGTRGIRRERRSVPGTSRAIRSPGSRLPAPKGAFTVVVPVTDTARHVAVTKVAPGPAGPAPRQDASARGVSDAVTTDIATFPLTAPGRAHDTGGTP